MSSFNKLSVGCCGCSATIACSPCALDPAGSYTLSIDDKSYCMQQVYTGVGCSTYTGDVQNGSPFAVVYDSPAFTWIPATGTVTATQPVAAYGNTTFTPAGGGYFKATPTF